tara:strand:+ start:694 stop:1896 length:1203 start_codon:yes stop_codon:yes gene_type:complete
MKTFEYSYKEKDEIINKKIKANSIQDAKNFLKRKNITPISIKVEGGGFFKNLSKNKTVKSDEIVAFSQLFGGCIESGLSIKESLELLSKQIRNTILKEKCKIIITDIETGTSISDSFKKHTDVFPVFFPMLLKAGEASGNLAGVLEYISSYLDKTNNLKKQIGGVLTYPLVVSTFGAGLIYIILIFVAPTFKNVFSESGKPLPGPTKILFGLSDIAIKYYDVGLGSFLVFIIALYFIGKTHRAQLFFDTYVFKIPLAGEVVKKVLILRFLGAFDILVNNKVPMTEALIVLEDATINLKLKGIITDMRKDVARGLSLAGPLMDNKDIISPMVGYTISMGEKAGNLGTSLTRITNFMDKELTYSMKRLSSTVDPILTAALGGVLLFVAMSVYLPIFSLMDTG